MGYSSAWIGKKDEILGIVRNVAAKNPEDFKLAGKRNPDGSEVPGNDVFIKKAAIEVAKVYVDCGNNGKRGDVNNMSRDVLVFPNPAGARDATGRYLGLEIIDVIVGAGGANPSVDWTDVTQATIDSGNPGAWIKPSLEDSGNGGGTVPPPQVVIPPFPPRDETLSALMEFDKAYMDAGRDNRCKKGAEPLYIDNEGIAVWLSEYLRRRQLGESHAQAIMNVKEDMYAAGLPRPQED